MRLVLVADTFPPLRTSGAVQLRDLARELVRQGHALTVLLPLSDTAHAWIEEDFEGARIVRIKAPPTKGVGYVRRTINEWLMPRAMLKNLKQTPYAATRWDGVIWYSPSIFHGPLVRWLKRQSGCRAYLVLRDMFPEWALELGLLRKGPAYYFFKAVARQQYRLADTIGVQSPGNLAYFSEWRGQGARGRVEVLQNWLGAPSDMRCRIRVSETKLAGRKIFVYAGNMGIAQGMDLILDLAARMQTRRDIGFLFVGRGSDIERLRGEADRRAIDNVQFEDEIDPDEIPDLYAQCFAGIVSLDTRHRSHNIPGKFLTYMQNGLPVLASINPGNDLSQVILDARVGQVCESGDIDDLAAACANLISDISKDSGISERCLSLFSRSFSVNGAAKQIVKSLH